MSDLKLGFVEEAKPWTLVSHLFPDKIGGRPAWLSLKNTPKTIKCPNCNQPLPLLLQLYSPIDEREDCFHRTIYVFMCLSGKCFSKSMQPPFRVYRCQLGRTNSYYSFDPPTNDELSELETLKLFKSKALPTAINFGTLCPVCGCHGSKLCSSCMKATYCCKEHQTLHWNTSHKQTCNEYDYLNEMFTQNSYLLPEFGLASELAENLPVTDDSDTDEEKDSFQFTGDEEFDALEKLANAQTPEDCLFNKFKNAMSSEPDQVVRYNRNGSPIWIRTSLPQIPPCRYCGCERIFEFQITSQILSYLQLDKVGTDCPDFATVYIFTCKNSCALLEDSLTEYAEEFVLFDPVP